MRKKTIECPCCDGKGKITIKIPTDKEVIAEIKRVRELLFQNNV